MSTLAATNLKHASSASNNIVLDSSGNATFAGTAVPSSSFLRNRIINGDMRIDQRNAGASVPGPGVSYPVDRWAFLLNSGSGNTLQQVSDGPAGFNNSLKVTIGTGATPTTSQQNIIFQTIEGFNVADFGLGASGATTFTVSFWVKSSITGTYSSWFQNSGSARSYVASFVVNSANTWEYKTITVVGDVSGTWLKTNGAGLTFGVSIGAGSTYQTTAGVWASGDFKGSSGSVNLVATSGATFYLTGVQLEVGSAATPFERRQYGQEFALCQRYFQRMENILVFISAWSTTPIMVSLRATMRAVPTVALSALSAGSGGAYGALDENVLYQSVANSSQATGRLTASAEL